MAASIPPITEAGATEAHGTHVAGIVLGTGGPTGLARGSRPRHASWTSRCSTISGSEPASPEALDWCVHNRARDWGTPDYAGIDVINLSLSSTDLTDGNDAASRLADRAVQQGS